MSKPEKCPNRHINETMENASGIFVFTKIIHLGLMLTDNVEICEPVTEFGAELDENAVRDLEDRIDLYRVLQARDDGADDSELPGELYECAREQGRWGFLCYAEAPEVQRLDKGLKRVLLGLRHCRWFYGETLEEIIPQADAWALSQEERGAAIKLARSRATRTPPL